MLLFVDMLLIIIITCLCMYRDYAGLHEYFSRVCCTNISAVTSVLITSLKLEVYWKGRLKHLNSHCP